MDRNDSTSPNLSLSLGHVLVVPLMPLMQTGAKVSIEIMANQFVLEHMPLLQPFVSRRECFVNIISIVRHFTICSFSVTTHT
jgi:hypothetical protein